MFEPRKAASIVERVLSMPRWCYCRVAVHQVACVPRWGGGVWGASSFRQLAPGFDGSPRRGSTRQNIGAFLFLGDPFLFSFLKPRTLPWKKTNLPARRIVRFRLNWVTSEPESPRRWRKRSSWVPSRSWRHITRSLPGRWKAHRSTESGAWYVFRDPGWEAPGMVLHWSFLISVCVCFLLFLSCVLFE